MEGPGVGDRELVTRTVTIEQKIFYLDLKENARGRYLKISEKSSMSRSTIVVPLAGVVWFVDLFNYYANGDGGELSSKELQLATKVFYFDPGANNRGRFLKVAEASVARNRSTVIVPAGGTGDAGWAAFRNALVEIHEASLALPLPAPAAGAAAGAPGAPQAAAGQAQTLLPQGGYHAGAVQSAATVPATAPAAVAPSAGVPGGGVVMPGMTAGGGFVAPLASGAGSSVAGGSQADSGGHAASGADGQSGNMLAMRVIRAEQKRFFLDLGSNVRGQYLKISEVLGQDRSSIIIPASALPQLHEYIGELLAHLQAQGLTAPSGPHVRTLAPVQKRTDS